MSIVERALEKAGALGRAAAAKSGSVPLLSGRRLPAPSQKDGPRDDAKTVDLARAASLDSGLFPPTDMEHRVADELRLITRPLLLNAEGHPTHLVNGNLVMIGSALPGAGKTFLSLNLAMSMASELDWTVVLIDADVNRPALSRRLGLGDAPGLVSLLEEERGNLSDYLLHTTMPRLHFLPAGPVRANAKELLGSQRMRSLLADLTASHDRRIVIFDSPPLLLTSDARVLASYVGQVLLVVEAGVTPRRSLLEAIEILDPAKAINLVLNKNRQLVGVGDYHYAGYLPYGHESTDTEA